LAGHLIVTLPGPVQAAVEAAPGVEGPVASAQFGLCVDHEGGAGVAYPGIIVTDFQQTDLRMVEVRTGVVELCGRHADTHRLELGDGLGYGREGRLCGLAAESPVVRAPGPDHPGLAVRLPFGPHEETVP